MLGSVLALGSSLSLLPPAQQPQQTGPGQGVSQLPGTNQAPAAAARASDPGEEASAASAPAQGQGPSPQAKAAASIAAAFLEKPAQILNFATTQRREAFAEQASDRERSRIAALAQAERDLVGSWVERMRSDAPSGVATPQGGEPAGEAQKRFVIAAYREAGA